MGSVSHIQATIKDSCCSNCGAHLKKNQNGAEYAKKQKTLNAKQRLIVSWFCNNGLTDYASKKTLFEKFTELQEIGPSAFSARMSELKALGFFQVTKEIKDGPLSTIEGPFYKFNFERLNEYLKRGGLN